VPVGALCVPEGRHLKLRAIVAAPDGSRVVEGEGVGGDPGALGAVVAARLREQGALEILRAP
jgi:porphobilinogen deaminase